MKLWEELEQEPEYGLLTPENKAALHDEWRSSLLGSLADEDPEVVDSAGVNRFVATERARNQALKTGQPFYTALVSQGALVSDTPFKEVDNVTIKTIFPGSNQTGYTPIY